MNIEKIKNHIRKIPTRIWILILIIAVGIFFRTWHLHDWLRFNPDQARDLVVAESVAGGQKSWIRLGPEVGNARFYLGPWFYHLEALSAKIFGSAPDKAAYPDLLFSILTIPLLYFFLKKYFSTGLSLALTGLFSVSFFAVTYSRFAWNPNSIPFFVLVFLLGILNMLGSNKRKSFWGAAMVGAGIGVGMQLHILLLFIMPAVAAVFLFFMFFRKNPVIPVIPFIARISIIILLALIVNAGQIIYELKNGNSNIRKFMKSTDKEMEVNPWKNLQMDLLCQAQADLHIVSSLASAERCDFFEYYQELIGAGEKMSTKKEKTTTALLAGGVIFFIAGFAFLVYRWRRETDGGRKIFLALVALYGLSTIVAMFPVIKQVEPRYYIVSFFLPFVFLGTMVEGLARNKKLWAKISIAAVFAFLFWLNFSAEAKMAGKFFAGQANDAENCYLGETEKIADYIISNSNGSKVAYLPGKNDYVSRYFKPLSYFLKNEGIDLKHYEGKKTNPAPGAFVFFVVKTNHSKYLPDGKIGIFKISQMETFGNVMVVIPEKQE